MPTFNSALKAQLDSVTTKSGWSSTVATALGTSRRLRIYRDSNASATDPAATGTEVLNVGITGDMTFNSGNIVGFGAISGTTVRQAADLSTGASVLRIDGNGNWVQFTIGLTGSGKEYILGASLTTTSGIAFTLNSQLKAPRFLPTGVGTAAPSRTASSARTISFYDYTVSASPTLACVVDIDTRKDDWVYQDQEMANGNGDVGFYQSSNDSVWGKYRIGATLTLSAAANTVVGNIPYQQVVAAFTYSDPAWVNYPDIVGYDRKNMVLTLPPFKAVLKDANGNTLYTWQMPDGSPINDPSLYSANLNDGARMSTVNQEKALNPRFNIQQGLYWENTAPRVSDVASKIYPGLDTAKYRPSTGKRYLTFNAVEPLITGGYQNDSLNGIAHYWYAPQHPLPPKPQAITDPYLDDNMNNGGGSSPYTGWIQGYAYAPAAMGTHNWYTGPGGPRPTRCVYPSIYIQFMTDPTGSKPQFSASWRDMADGFRKNHWNISNMFVASASTMKLDDNTSLLTNKWASVGNYYGDYSYSGKAIRLNCQQRDGTSANDYDVAGNLIGNGAGPDPLHDYNNRGISALFFNDPMSAVGSKFDTVMSFILHRDPDKSMATHYLIRDMAWQWRTHTIAWKLGTNHPNGFSQKEIEDRFQIVLEALYRDVYAPAFVNNDQSVLMRCIRNLGTSVTIDDGGNWHTPGGRLGFYMAWVLMLMKQTGFWSRMRAKSAKCAAVLDMMIRNMDIFCFDVILDTDGACDSSDKYYFGSSASESGIPTSWADYQQKRGTRSQSFVTNSSGAYVADPDVSYNHVRAYAYIRSRYFPEYTSSRMTAAIAKFDQYEQVVIDAVNAASTPLAKSVADHLYGYAGVLPPKAPATLGPA